MVLITLLCTGLPCMSCRHGDLKAGNVLLLASTGVGRAGSGAQQQELLRVWTQAGCLPLTAKVADFGLALPLGPTDTHATLLARVSPCSLEVRAKFAGMRACGLLGALRQQLHHGIVAQATHGSTANMSG
jgi:hypothetical protein